MKANVCVPKLDLQSTIDEEEGNEPEGEGNLSSEAIKKREEMFANSSGVAFGEEVRGPAQAPHIRPEQRRMHYILREYTAVTKDPIEGVYITISYHDPLKWFGLLILRAGIFCGGLFKFTLTLPADFPDSEQIPSVQFEDALFHPLINAKTRFCDLDRFFPSGWQRDRNHVYQVLTATQSMFFRCKVESGQAANPEAAILLAENPTQFKKMARDVVRRSRTQIYDLPTSDDPNAIRFSPWNGEQMESVRQYLTGKSTSPPPNTYAHQLKHRRGKSGLSWVDAERCMYMCNLVEPVVEPVVDKRHSQGEGEMDEQS